VTRGPFVAMLLAACGGSDVSRTVGAECNANGDCDEQCLMGGHYPNGFCSVSCDNDDGCPSETHCIEDMGGVCLFACDFDSDCEFLGQGYTCVMIGVHASNTMVKVCRAD